MKRHTPVIPAGRAAIAILIVGFFFATAFYRCGTPSPPPAPPAPAPAPVTTPVPAPEPAYDPDQGRDPTMESAETTTSYADQDQQGAAVNCGMVHGGSLINGVCYHGSSNTGSGSANQIGDGDPLGDIVDTVVDGVNSATDWWESDPLNDQAEEVFDNLNTVVETVDEKIIGDGICSGLGQAITGEAGPGAGVAAWMTCSVRE